MYTIKTNKTFPIRNTTYEIVENKIIFLTVQKLEVDKLGIIATGYYYYKKIEVVNEVEVETIIKLKPDDNRTVLPWYNISQIEAYVLPVLSVATLTEAILQRVLEFTQLQLTQESGQNFNILIEDWDFTNLD